MRTPVTWSDTLEEMSSSFARAAGVYGMNPLLGRLYGVLFFSPEPLTLGDLAEAVGSAKSTVSVAMRKLEGAKIVQRHWRKGDRRDFYEAVADPHKLIADWSRTFFQAEMEAWTEATTLGTAALAAAPSDGPDEAGRAEIAARIESFNTFGALMVETFSKVLAEHTLTTPPEPAS